MDSNTLGVNDMDTKIQALQKRTSGSKSLWAAGVTTVLVAGLFLAVSVTPLTLFADNAGNRKVNPAEYRRQLKNQVDTPAGEPRDGRDPMTQQQNSLAQAAASPVGNGTRTDKPAAAATGHAHHGPKHADVYGDVARTGINAAGCYVDYGIPGEQCVRAAQHSTAPVCSEIRRTFPQGVKVSGKDRFGLDRNKNSVACDRKD